MDHIDAVLEQALVAHLQGLDVALAGNDFVGQGTGGVEGFPLDQGDVDGVIHHAQVLGGGGATVTAAHHDHSRLGLGGMGVGNRQDGGAGSGGEGLEEGAAIESMHGVLLPHLPWAPK
jgi:hypothetical protein